MKIEIEINDKLITDTLITAREGGCRYWATINCSRDVGIYAFDHGQFWNVFETDMRDEERNRARRRQVRLETIAEGLKVMVTKYPGHFANLVGDHGDAETADVLLQCIVFGELVYG